jgi:hypothetical protein
MRICLFPQNRNRGEFIGAPFVFGHGAPKS